MSTEANTPAVPSTPAAAAPAETKPVAQPIVPKPATPIAGAAGAPTITPKTIPPTADGQRKVEDVTEPKIVRHRLTLTAAEMLALAPQIDPHAPEGKQPRTMNVQIHPNGTAVFLIEYQP